MKTKLLTVRDSCMFASENNNKSRREDLLSAADQQEHDQQISWECNMDTDLR